MKVTASLFLFVWLVVVCPASAESARPNVVLILADDMGWGDPRCYNPDSKIPTPHLDRLAAEGVRFTDAHTPSAVCTPTRYGLLTGRYSWRTWLKRGVLDGFDPPLIEEGRPTLASFLKEAGYATACVGKWHLGMTWTRRDGTPMPYRMDEGVGIHRGGAEVDFTREASGGPVDRGFETWFGISASLDMSPYAYMEGRRVTELPTASQPKLREEALSTSEGVRAPGFELEAVLPEFTRRAVERVETLAAAEKPFFLYLPLPSPHLPVAPAKEWLGKTGAGIYADFAAQTDATVGAVLDALERAGCAGDTLVLFTSDNGGLWHQWEPRETDDAAYRPTPRAAYNHERGHHSNADWRGTKADIYEGGHRVPFIARWPARVKPAVSGALVELNDVFATVAEILDAPLPEAGAEDSVSFWSVLQGGEPKREFAVHHSLQGVFALRKGAWKYAEARGSGGFSAPRKVNPKAGEPVAQLYRLDRDPAETTNLAGEETEVAKELADLLAEIRASERTRK